MWTPSPAGGLWKISWVCRWVCARKAASCWQKRHSKPRFWNKKAVWKNQAGLKVELLDRAALQAKAPYLSDSVLMGAFCADEGKADPRRASLALAAAARALGAQILSQCQVVDLKRVGSDWQAQVLSGEQCRSKQVLIAAGVWSGRIAQMTGSQLPVSPIALTMTATARTAPFMDYLFQHVGRRLSLKQTAEGTVLIGGGWPSTLHHRNGIADLERKPSLNLDSLQRSVQTACSVVPPTGLLACLALLDRGDLFGVGPTAIAGPSAAPPRFVHCHWWSRLHPGFDLRPFAGSADAGPAAQPGYLCLRS